ARLGGMAVSAYRSQTRSVPAYRRPECLLKSRMCERHLSGSVRAWAATFGEHPVYSTCALSCCSLVARREIAELQTVPYSKTLLTELRTPVLRPASRYLPNQSGLSCMMWRRHLGSRGLCGVRG